MSVWLAVALGLIDLLRWSISKVEEDKRIKVYEAIQEKLLREIIDRTIDDMRRVNSDIVRDDLQRDLFRD